METISPSRLVETHCQINEVSSTMDKKTSTCLLTMKIEEPSEVDGKEPTQRIINMELPPATLKTLVNDLSRIREQLSNIAKK
ncbi:hypothetical protein PV328_000710 [Microctonus aethiopoides]|uniref:COMM domain-containing protein n=1 Tax=Microctonus aethiopoides TaxID=144406 RepID=A0AA39KWW9_9HYME|nr:hypothetical protein PV328_000710 [Microctonus aethiopoides]